MLGQTHSHDDLPSPQTSQEQQIQELQLIRQLRQQDSPEKGSLLQGNQQALQLRQADLAAASSAGSVSPGATVGHRPLSRAHSSPVVGKHTKIIILAVFSSSLFFWGGGGASG